MSSPASDIWAAVDRLVDRTGNLDHLRAHRIQLLAARRWRALGAPVPAALEREERHAAIVSLVAPVLLRRVRDAYDGSLVVLKGPEAASHYPDVALRPYGDLDLLVADANEAQRALLAAGFAPIGDPRLYHGIHHEQPLALPGLPLYVELHSQPKWPAGFPAPRAEELLEAAVPCSLGVDGAFALPPSHHAVVLAAHAWAHDPLRRVGDLLDVAAVSAGLDGGELASLAARWGLARIWDTTAGAADALLEGGASIPLRIWAGHLGAVRDRTVIESHLDRWLSGFWALPPHRALGAMGRELVRDVYPAPGETLAQKLSRSRLALRNAFVGRTNHVDQLERAGINAPSFLEVGEADPPGR